MRWGCLLLLLCSCAGPFAKKDCRDACARLYEQEGGACNIQSPGATSAELISTCEEECIAASKIRGQARADYQPNTYTPSDKSIMFENRDEVELWVDCVENTSCDFLDSGFCQPVW